jgi:sirohydrochlorin cobaltochelatase
MRRFIPTLLALLGPGALRAQAPAEQAPAPVGTILVAHGADGEWNRPVLDLAAAVRTGGPVEVAFLMGRGAAAHRFQDAARRFVEGGVKAIVVVPLLVSSHSGHYEQIRYLAGLTDSLDPVMQHHLHMAGLERVRANIPVMVTPALDDAPELGAVLADRARALAAAPRQQALFIIGHGPNSAEDYAAWMARLRPVADSVREHIGFRDVKVGLVRDDAPAEVRAEAVRRIREIITLQHQLTGRPVVVVPVLISGGAVARVKLVRDLAGLPIVYRGDPLLPHPSLERWVERRVREAAQGIPVGGSRAAHGLSQ